MSRTATTDATSIGEDAIQIVGLAKSYGKNVAVDGLDLRVRRGETFALLGPNGAGKTTTIECCEGFRKPDAGVVRVLGLDPHRDGRLLRPRVGLMLQEGGVYPLARPREVVRLFASFYRDPLDADEILEQVGLRPVDPTRFRDLSGGQKQRLSLALALVGRPELVFLDEPTSGMDPLSRQRTWELIRQLRDRGVTVVLTTHLLDEAEQLADRVAIVDHGRLVALGTPDELTHGGQDGLTFTASPALDTDELSRQIGAVVTESRSGHYEVAGPSTPAHVARLAVCLEQQGVMIGELQAAKRSLEQVFLRLTEEVGNAEVGGNRVESLATGVEDVR